MNMYSMKTETTKPTEMSWHKKNLSMITVTRNLFLLPKVGGKDYKNSKGAINGYATFTTYYDSFLAAMDIIVPMISNVKTVGEILREITLPGSDMGELNKFIFINCRLWPTSVLKKERNEIAYFVYSITKAYCGESLYPISYIFNYLDTHDL